MKLFKDINVEKRVLKPFKIDNKLFFPVVEIVTITNEISFNSLTVSPLAFLVKENDDKYLIWINEDKIDEDEILELVLSFQ